MEVDEGQADGEEKDAGDEDNPDELPDDLNLDNAQNVRRYRYVFRGTC